MMEWVLVLLGLGILLFAGDALVKGAVNLSLRLGVPALIVSLTIVAFGTSAPELLIAVSAVIEDVPGLALGNVVGSNTANILLVLGVPALVAGLDAGSSDTRKTYAFMILASLLFVVLAYFGPFTWVSGLILLSALAFVLSDAFREARAHRRAERASPSGEESAAVEGADPKMRGRTIAIYLVLGLIGLPLGAEILVHNATAIARDFGVSETVIGLTLVAIGTSLPELATTVVAAMRKQAEVALGSVIGSNMFNLLAIIGIASLVGPIPVSPQILSFDIWVMFAASLLLVPFVLWGWRFTRPWGFALTGLYVAYVASVLS